MKVRFGCSAEPRASMRLRAAAIAVLVNVAILASVAIRPTVAQAAPAKDSPDAIRAQVDAGRLLYAGSCANCHGSTGQGAIGPALADRALTPELLRNTVLNGRVGTPMPPFKDELDATSIAQILAYVEWITSGGRLPARLVSIDSPSADAAGSSEPSAKPQPVGAELGVPARGAALFFDPTSLSSCRTCHSYANKGGPVGPDLSGARHTPPEVLHALAHARVPAHGFHAVSLEMLDGTGITGIASDETGDVIRVFDLTSLPPVLRTVRKSDIKTRTAIADAGIFDHTALHYARQDLLDLSAFLGR